MNQESNLNLAERIEALGEFQKNTQDKLLSCEEDLDHWIQEMVAVNVQLREKLKIHQAAPPVAQETVSSSPTSAAGDDYKVAIEKLLQGSIETLGNKLSDKILGMLKDLKTISGPMREAKLMEIRDTARSEDVDLAGLFLHEKVESNLGAEGVNVEEKKTKGIGSILDKLKKMKGDST